MFPQFLLPGIFGALLLGFLAGGGVACVQHVCLRFVLWQSGVAPRNLAQILNYCVERRLLQRVGGRYRFLHRELLDHFAQPKPLNSSRVGWAKASRRGKRRLPCPTWGHPNKTQPGANSRPRG